MKFLRPMGMFLILAAFVVLLPRVAQAQRFQDRDREEGGTVCSSYGERVTCDADTHDGVRLRRQLGSEPCIQGRTWGFTDRGIWVDRGCSALFEPAFRQASERIEPGALITVQTQRFISSDRSDGRVYPGLVYQDIYGEDGRLAIPNGSPVEMIVRVAPDNDLMLDLESVTINGRRYTIDAGTRLESEKREGIGGNQRTLEHVGGGAIIGSIIGAIAGGGKGAAIGAGAGAAAGAGTQMITRGREVRVPPESVLTFRLDRPLVIAKQSYDRDRDYDRDRR